MPQNAVIGVGGDYSTLAAWAAGERTSNYGAPTRCYIDGVVASSAVVLFHTATSGWPNGAELYALTGQAFDGTTLGTCAAITHGTGPIDVGDVDVDIQGLLIDVTGGYNNKNIKFASSISTTKRRKLTLKNLALRSSPNYHGATCALDLNLNSTNLNNQYDLDIADVIIIPRANNAAFSLVAVSGTLDISGTVKNITILPSNSGSSVKTGFALGLGSACTVDVSSVLSLGSEVRTAYIDYSKDAGFGGTATNIVTKDATGTITGKTTATELENYAAGDYRLKASGLGFGAFKQSGGVAQVISSGGSVTRYFAGAVKAQFANNQQLNTTAQGIALRSAQAVTQPINAQQFAAACVQQAVRSGVAITAVVNGQQINAAAVGLAVRTGYAASAFVNEIGADQVIQSGGSVTRLALAALSATIIQTQTITAIAVGTKQKTGVAAAEVVNDYSVVQAIETGGQCGRYVSAAMLSSYTNEQAQQSGAVGSKLHSYYASTEFYDDGITPEFINRGISAQQVSGQYSATVTTPSYSARHIN